MFSIKCKSENEDEEGTSYAARCDLTIALSKLPFSSLEPGDEMTESVFENIHRALAAMTNL